MVYYSLVIFQNAEIDMNNHILAIVVQSGLTFGYVISTPMMSKLPRRFQFITSGLLMSLSSTALGVSILINDQVRNSITVNPD